MIVCNAAPREIPAGLFSYSGDRGISYNMLEFLPERLANAVRHVNLNLSLIHI